LIGVISVAVHESVTETQKTGVHLKVLFRAGDTCTVVQFFVYTPSINTKCIENRGGCFAACITFCNA